MTAGNSQIFIKCPYGYDKSFSVDDKDVESKIGEGYKASRRCKCNDTDCQNPFWLDPDTSRCKYHVYNDSKITDALSILYQVSRIKFVVYVSSDEKCCDYAKKSTLKSLTQHRAVKCSRIRV